MGLERFLEQVRSAEELSTLMGIPTELSLRKELRSLDDHMRKFIAHSPFIVLSTHSADGRCDASPRGDAKGFVQIVDEQTLLIPDRLGNKRVDSYRNILQTGRIGLLFLIPGLGETLRINGRAALITERSWLTPMTVQGKCPKLAVAVEVEECFLQCAKSIIRSRLWEPSIRPNLESLPCAVEMLNDHAKIAGFDITKMQTLLDDAYANKLY